MIKSRRMEGLGHVARVEEMRNEDPHVDVWNTMDLVKCILDSTDFG